MLPVSIARQLIAPGAIDGLRPAIFASDAYWSVGAGELPGEVDGDLRVLDLVGSDGNLVRVEREDVGGDQSWVVRRRRAWRRASLLAVLIPADKLLAHERPKARQNRKRFGVDPVPWTREGFAVPPRKDRVWRAQNPTRVSRAVSP